mmetsp:Transcript_58125/g.106973  ORF Transcript_58125/g.106973 Transcript_58125/m.106973 type:complete len:799 (-) Transcript_58125:43-2439(-)
MRAACRATLSMAPPLFFLIQAALTAMASTEQEIPSDSHIARGSGPLTEKGARRLSDSFTVQQQHHFKVRQSGAVDVESTVTFHKLGNLTSVNAPIMSHIDMHCIDGEILVSDGAGETAVASQTVSGSTLFASFNVPANHAADTFNATMRYSIAKGICETGDGGPKRFYFPWVQRWSNVVVNSTTYQIEFPDEHLDVTNFVCLGATDLDRKCGSALGIRDGVMVYKVSKFLDDAFFEWEMPRSPSKGRICPYRWGSGSSASSWSCNPLAGNRTAMNSTAGKSSSSDADPKMVMLFICIAGSVLAVSIIIGQTCHNRNFIGANSEGADNAGNPNNPGSKASGGATSHKSEKEIVSVVAYIGYALLLFFAYWFGAHRFDYDGDGDFDEYDVQAYLKDKGILRKQFKKSRLKNKPKKGKPAVLKALKKAAGFKTADDRDDDGTDSPEDPEENPDDGISLDDVEIQPDGSQIQRQKRDQERIAQRFFVGQDRPWFTIINGVISLLLWLIFATKLAAEGKYNWFEAKAGLEPSETFELKLTNIMSCDDLRPQIWRWLTYQYIHVGFLHILTNIALFVILGIPLEGYSGTKRLMAMFNVGVFGGACAVLVCTPHTPTVGMSGGIYALFGIHLADLMMNWHSKKYRIPTLTFLVFLFVNEILLSVASANSSTSHSAHFGGFFFGMLIGLLLTKRQSSEGLSFERWEQIGRPVLVYGSIIVGTLLSIISLAWTLGSWPPREPFDPTRWCWSRAVSSYQIFDTNDWNCVRCATQECMRAWSLEPHVRSASVDWCKETGWFNQDLPPED